MFLIIPILVEILIDVLTPLNKVFISLIQPDLHLLIRRLHRVEESLIFGALIKLLLSKDLQFGFFLPLKSYALQELP